MDVDGIDSIELAAHLWIEHRILVSAIKHADFEGICDSSSLYTTLDELDQFCDAVEGAIEHGLPSR